MGHNWLRWISPDDRMQIYWASMYLARNGYADFSLANPYSVDGAAFIGKMASYEFNNAFRYRADKMRAAWRQKQYRARNGQQTAFQLPKSVRADLARLAAARKQAKVETLRQIIVDAANQRYCEKREIKEVRDTYKKEIEQREAQRVKEVEAYRRSIACLLNVFAEELYRRCRLEVAAGALDNSVLEGESVDSCIALVEERITELEAGQAELVQALSSGPPLLELVRKLAQSTRL